MRSLELVERLKPYKTLIWTLPFIPMGGLRRSGWTIVEKILEDPLRRELVIKGLHKSFDTIVSLQKLPTFNMRSILDKLVWEIVGRLAMGYFIKRVAANIPKSPIKKSPMIVRKSSAQIG